jgi:trigger factor
VKSTIEAIEVPENNDQPSDESAANAVPPKLVKLSVTIDEHEFDRDIDAAFKAIGRQVNLPGFRPGKVPRKVLEARIGIGAAREQALRDSVPSYLASAVREHDIDLIATPRVEITAGEESGAVSFDATCEVRPEIMVPGYGGLRVQLPAPTATDEEITAAIDAERQRQGTLVDVDRVVEKGDHVTLTLAGTRAGEPVPGLNTDDWLYEVGKGWVAEGFDDHLIGAAKGAELSFSATPNGTSEPADFDVTVTNVQRMELPDVTDEWVAENLGEFDTVDAWRAALAERIGDGKLNQARSQFIDRTTEALAQLVDIEPPTSMVEGDLQGRVQNTVRQFQAQGIDLGQWLQATGQDPDAFVGSLRQQSVIAAKVDLALRAVAVAENIQVTDDDLGAEYARLAMRFGQKASEVRKAYERNDAVTDLMSNIRKTKALDFVLESAELVDPDGNPIDRALVMGDRNDRHHDHDHDHHDHDHHDQ